MRSLAFTVLAMALMATACGKDARVEKPTPPSPASTATRPSVSNTRIVEELRARAYDATESVPGVVVNLPDVYLFAFGSSAIERRGRTKLRELAAYLARPDLANRSLSVEGHTDSVGTDAVNQALSERRADAVRRELLTGGVDGSRLVARGFGESRPVAPNARPDGGDDPAGRARNRRVEVIIGNGE